MISHTPSIEIERDTPTIAAERNKKRRELTETIAQFEAKPTDVVSVRAINQLKYALSRLGGPIE